MVKIMTSSDDDKREIIEHPMNYLNKQKETLHDRLKSIQLDAREQAQLTQRVTQELIRDKVLGLFKIGELAKTFLDFNESIEHAINSAKRDVLLQKYFEKSEENESAVQQLRNLLTDPQGNTLFNKILRILDDSPPDPELMDHLSTALKVVAESNFRDLFEAHKFALSQIEQISPQGLTILADSKRWPEFQLGTFSTVDGKVTTDYVNEFASAYAVSKGIVDAPMINRLGHSIRDLINRGLLEAHQVANAFRCVITEIGRLVTCYIKVD